MADCQGATTNTSTNPTHPINKPLFLIAVTLIQLVQSIPLGAGINTGLFIAAALSGPSSSSSSSSHTSASGGAWITASYPLTQGTFVLIGGRLGAVYGHKTILAAGALWWVVWALAGGYATDLVSMCLMRGLCGMGGGLMTPNVVALIGVNFPPGRVRNLGMALFGAAAPVGAAGGSLVAAVVVQLAGWRWLFFMLGLLGAVVYGIAFAVVPGDEPVDANGIVDYAGAYFGVGGLTLFNFVWNQAPVVGWGEPYQIVLLLVSVLHFAAFWYWETRVAGEPILPFNIWKSPSFGILMITIFFSYMSLGIFFWYMNVYMQTIRGDSLIQTGVQYLPLTIVGAINSFFAAWLVPRVRLQLIIGTGCFAMVVINVLLATIPADITYWVMAFPAMLVSAFTIDLITTSAQIIASNTVAMKHQGVAGSLVGTLLSYGMSTGLGFAGTVEMHTSEHGVNLLRGYHSAAYLAVGMSGCALLLCFFIQIPRDTIEGWVVDDMPAAERR
ncbi:MFS general substrate transporter [Parathielavia appendiculata]|uniref:MFS general substrate transporter n=1 Tax=Parathielavia appendiculata TaxID=2587402 RepID=A0AAN6TRA2_9PEZI|nr:MFS general substrate transporter [Parathielavia appendiculata]